MNSILFRARRDNVQALWKDRCIKAKKPCTYKKYILYIIYFHKHCTSSKMVCSITLLLHTLHFFCFPSLHIFLLVFLCSPFPPSFSSSLGMGRYFFVEQIFTTAEPRVMIPLPLRAARNDRGDTREIILQPLSPPARTNTGQGISTIQKVLRK